MTSNHQADTADIQPEQSPLSISRTDAISHLTATGDWPSPSPAMAEPETDYYVLAAFWNDPEGLLAYLAKAWALMAGAA